jgi:polysaccharide pyruvyl transferase WcaK-like protein
MVAVIEQRRQSAPDVTPDPWPSDRALRLLLVGYSGTRNIGADVRTAEMIRQFRHVFGAERVDFEMLAIGGHGFAEKADGVVTTKLEGYLPDMLAGRLASADGVVACEGSMFKSNFSNMLALVLTGGLALASAERKLAVAWAAEAGAMEELLRRFVEGYCSEALVLARNPPSNELLAGCGLRTFLGADPAWTYRPASRERAEEVLASAGWDGAEAVTCVCPVNPFWYPVRPDVARARELARTGAHREDHFASVLFHEHSAEAVGKYHAYLDQLAEVLRERPGLTVIVGMEALDQKACEDLAARLGGKTPILLSHEQVAADVVAVLRRADLLISSRYHALLTATPGLVPLVGVATDERIPNLLGELGRPELAVPADAADLSQRLAAAIAGATSDIDDLNRAQGRLATAQIRRIGLGGQRVAAEVADVYPGFHRPATTQGWEDFIPPLDPVITQLLEIHA